MTSAQKNCAGTARIEKGISLLIDRASGARNFTSISRLTAMASRANTRDRKFLHRNVFAAQISARDRKFICSDEKNFLVADNL